MRLFGQPAAVPGEEIEPPVADGVERRQKERKPAAPGIKVLIIDDSTTIVALLRRMMRQNEFETLEAGDAETGIELARSEIPHLIFLDIVLPGMNGFNALRVLRRDNLTRHIPIIMISGNEQATEEFYVHRIGADDFMKKPFARAEVFARIERLMDEGGTPRRVNMPAAEVG
jgi:twitching motility two-component system response regulator PilH